MAVVNIRAREWVVVCDGAKALILENAGSALEPQLQAKEVREHEAAKTHELGTDAPGRAFNSVGAKRSAMEQTDWHEQEETRFLQALAKRLDEAVTGNETSAIILAAPPRALGVIRQAYTPALRNAVRAEVQRDYVKLPPDEIARQIVKE